MITIVAYIVRTNRMSIPEFMRDLKVLYMKGKGGGRGSGKQNMFIDYLISQGVNVKVVDNAEGVRGMSFDYVIVDE